MRENTPEEIVKLIKDIPKSTHRISTIRSSVPEGAAVRQYPCIRCAAEVFHFPTLSCWDKENSVAGKCGDCARKRGYCIPVSLSPAIP